MREAKINRNTKETKISLTLNLDGQGKADINTGIPFLNHMLELFTKHGLFDLIINAKGDIDVDYHHTVEDIGICLGSAFQQALGTGKSITRYSSGLIPMDEALTQIAIDISGRPYLSFIAENLIGKTGDFDIDLLKEFFLAFVNNAKLTLHLQVLAGDNLHHIAESCFKGVGIKLDEATKIDNRKSDIPSTKGNLF